MDVFPVQTWDSNRLCTFRFHSQCFPIFITGDLCFYLSGNQRFCWWWSTKLLVKPCKTTILFVGEIIHFPTCLFGKSRLIPFFGWRFTQLKELRSKRGPPRPSLIQQASAAAMFAQQVEAAGPCSQGLDEICHPCWLMIGWYLLWDGDGDLTTIVYRDLILD